jgi:hypothetical protein
MSAALRAAITIAVVIASTLAVSALAAAQDDAARATRTAETRLRQRTTALVLVMQQMVSTAPTRREPIAPRSAPTTGFVCGTPIAAARRGE